MAVVPRYGRRVSAPGPGGHISQPVYDRGLAAWEEAAGQIFGVLKERDEEIKAAHESTEIIGRSAKYALGLDSLLTRTAELQVEGRMATPEEQEQYFVTETDKLAKTLMDWKGATPTAMARLQNNLVQETAQQVSTLRAINRSRSTQQIKDNMELGEQVALQTGSEVLLRQALDPAVSHGVISEAVREQRLKEFPVNTQLFNVRRQINMLDQSDVPLAAKIEGLDVLAGQLEGLRERELTDRQQDILNRTLEDVRQGKEAIQADKVKLDKQRIDATGRMVYSDIVTYENTAGKQGKRYTPAQLRELYIADALGKEQYDSLVKLITGKGEVDPWAALQAELLITDVDSGYRTLENAMVRQMELAPNLTSEQRAKFNTDLAKARSSWRGQLRRKAENAIENTINPPGTIIPIPGTVAAVAKLQIWDAIREAEDKQQPLAEERFMPLAVDIATRTLAEYKADRANFNAKHGFGSPGRSSAPAGLPEPKTVDEFTRTVQSIGNEDQARAYYDQWKDKF